jgi:protein phosphatase
MTSLNQIERRSGIERRKKKLESYPAKLDRRSGIERRRGQVLDLLTGEEIPYPDFRTFDGNAAESLKESIELFVMKSGDRVAVATDKGMDYKDWNEDRIGIDPQKNVVVVADGVGGHGNGDIAAQILVEAILKQSTDISLAVDNARQVMMQKRLGKGSACFLSAKIININDEKYLDVARVGDVKLVVYDQHGNIQFESKDESLIQMQVDEKIITADEALYFPKRHYVTNVVGVDKGEISSVGGLIPAEKGYRVAIMSDGISDNLTPDEIWRLTCGKTVEEAIAEISDVTDERMMCIDELHLERLERFYKKTFSDGFKSLPKKDNRALAIMDIS